MVAEDSDTLASTRKGSAATQSGKTNVTAGEPNWALSKKAVGGIIATHGNPPGCRHRWAVRSTLPRTLTAHLASEARK